MGKVEQQIKGWWKFDIKVGQIFLPNINTNDLYQTTYKITPHPELSKLI
jgi:hypothetical protein